MQQSHPASAVIGTNGNGIITLQNTSLDTWEVSQVSTQYRTAPVGSTSSLRYNGFQVSPLIPTGDVASGSPPVFLRAGERLTVEWYDSTPGDVVSAMFFYQPIGR